MIYFDIETLPTDNPLVIERVKANVKAPSNYKDQDKIDAYIESHADEAVHKTGLSGLFGQVLCIGYIIDNHKVDTLYLDDYSSEAEMLSLFREMVCTTKVKTQSFCSHTLVGHNAAGFDVPFLSQRMMVNGMQPLFRHGTKPWDMTVDDTMLMFAAGTKNMASLDNLCLAFGVESPKGGITGAEVHQAYLDGRHDEIKEYCKGDVEATRKIYQAMTGKASALAKAA